MNVFTFDSIYFFERQSHHDCWYAYTHPLKDPFAHGHFDVITCRHVRESGDGRLFSEQQKREIEQTLITNKSQMNLSQFEAHAQLPIHYKEIDSRSNRFSDFIDRLKWTGRTEPTFSIAFEKLTLREPAYRLTREFVSRVIEQMQQVSAEEVANWLHEVTLDS